MTEQYSDADLAAVKVVGFDTMGTRLSFPVDVHTRIAAD